MKKTTNDKKIEENTCPVCSQELWSKNYCDYCAMKIKNDDK